MPIHHTRDTGITYSTWYSLTDDETAAIVDMVESFEGDVSTTASEISLTDTVGPASTPGTNLFISVFSDDQQELPEDLETRVESTLTDAGIADYVRRVRVTADPAGEIYHETDDTDDTDKQYRARIVVGGGWQTTQTKTH